MLGCFAICYRPCGRSIAGSHLSVWIPQVESLRMYLSFQKYRKALFPIIRWSTPKHRLFWSPLFRWHTSPLFFQLQQSRTRASRLQSARKSLPSPCTSSPGSSWSSTRPCLEGRRSAACTGRLSGTSWLSFPFSSYSLSPLSVSQIGDKTRVYMNRLQAKWKKVFRVYLRPTESTCVGSSTSPVQARHTVKQAMMGRSGTTKTTRMTVV